MKKSDITMDGQLTKYEAAYKMAELMSKPNEMINAAKAQCDLVGMTRSRVETGNVGEFDGAETISEILQKVADEAGPEAALRLADAFGLEAAPAENEQTAELLNKAPPTDSVN